MESKLVSTVIYLRFIDCTHIAAKYRDEQDHQIDLEKNTCRDHLSDLKDHQNDLQDQKMILKIKIVIFKITKRSSNSTLFKIILVILPISG